MNLPQIALLLAEIRIQDVQYGSYVLERINAQLPAEQRFGEHYTGTDILKHFDILPYPTRNTLRNMTILSRKELEGLRYDVEQTKARLQNAVHEQDQTVRSWLELFVWFTLFYVTYKTMVYVFLIESSGEHLTGSIYKFLTGILASLGL